MTRSRYTKITFNRRHGFFLHRILHYPAYGCLGLLIFITLLSFPDRGHCRDTSARDAFKEYQVKAVFLYNLIHFVTWPESTFKTQESPYRICILGKDPFAGSLDKVVRDEHVKKRQLVVDRVTDVKNLRSCHILFISPSMEKELPQILEAVNHKAVLTVGDVEGFTQRGGIVNLVPKEGRITIEINPYPAIEAGLIISAKLLNLATIVTNRPSAENE